MDKPCVLFSPIGMTDPVGGDYDGPFLHILRHYKPEKAVLFMTKEPWERHIKDNRYCALASRICPETELEVLDKYNYIENAHKFEMYDEPFKEELEKLHRDFPNHRILANISSGTPQMEASLYLLSAILPFEITPIQVETPAKKSNKTKSSSDTFELETVWENIIENCFPDDAENRCVNIPLQNAHKAILQKNVAALVENYDYSAAITITQSAKELFSDKLLDLLTSAQYRSSMKISESIEKLRKSGFNISEFFEVQDTNIRNCYEYIQNLELILKRSDYNNFSRAVSPVLTDLMELACEKIFGKNPRIWYQTDKNTGVYKLSRNLLSQFEPAVLSELDNAFINGFKDCPAAASNLLIILQTLDLNSGSKNNKLISNFQSLRDFESKIRNLAAHEIIGFSDSDIKQKTGISSAKVLNMLKEIFSLCSRRNNLKWDGYEKFNDKIIKTLL